MNLSLDCTDARETDAHQNVVRAPNDAHSKLMLVAMIDSEIKKIVRRSDGLYLVALNAMLRARQLDDRAAGFRRCTQDIRVFSNRLASYMHDLLEMTDVLVNRVSGMAKQRRLRRILRRAGVVETSSLERSYTAEWQTLLRSLKLVERQTDIGENLVTRALIEAALTSSQEQLSLVAKEMDVSVSAIKESIAMIHRLAEIMERKIA